MKQVFKAFRSPLLWVALMLAVVKINQLTVDTLEGNKHAMAGDGLWLFFVLFLLVIDVWFRAALRGATQLWVQLVISVPVFMLLILPPVVDFYYDYQKANSPKPFVTKIYMQENSKSEDFLLLLFDIPNAPEPLLNKTNRTLVVSLPENGLYITNQKADNLFIENIEYAFKAACRECPDDTILYKSYKGEVSLEACDNELKFQKFTYQGKKYPGILFHINRDNRGEPYLIRCFDKKEDAFTWTLARKWLKKREITE